MADGLADMGFLQPCHPRDLASVFPDSRARRARAAVVATVILLGFYGGAGLLTTDAVSHVLSWISVLAITPAVAVVSRKVA